MNYKKFLGAASTALLIGIVTLMLAPGAWAQSKYKTLHRFKGGRDGALPYAGLVFDNAGNLYGTTVDGGDLTCNAPYGCGTVFKLAPNPDGSWTESVLHRFTGVGDGAAPYAGLIFDAAGNLYGATSTEGVVDYCCGTVFKLTPNPDGSWTETLLYVFQGLGSPSDGATPVARLLFDRAGNLYGLTKEGGNGGGVFFELTPNSDGSWTYTRLYFFLENPDDAFYPCAGLIFDAAGNLYSTAEAGSVNNNSGGAVFKVSPNSDGTWTLSYIHKFPYHSKTGSQPYGGLIFDAASNLYGTTSAGDTYGYGNIFKLTPNSNGSWTEHVLHHFTGGKDGANPYSGLIFDAVGDLYGTAYQGGATGFGVVFKLTPTSTGGWSYHVLHAFADKPGADPYADLIFDAAGNLYGTTYGDGSKTFGSVFEITP